MTATDSPALQCQDLRISVPGRLLVDDLDVEVAPGEFVAVLGQNGAGKSLTLLTLAGLRPAESGVVHLAGKDIQAAPRQWTARRLALLPQVIDDIFPATVLDTALIGRHPHIGRFRWESAEDREIAMGALRATQLEDLSERDILTLSGGERRRLAIAQVLTQAPDVYLLDEPTNHLDPQHQLEALRVFRAAADRGAAIVAALHDVNLAVRFADRCLLLFGDGRWEYGSREQALSESVLSELYSTQMEAVRWRAHELFVVGSGHEAP
ncbi:MAG TPA: ABC transporter ATP-binding protein [Woeseiaceae bacterium]|jgi:iron complex transport system ATP-binding protein|nr:ABC transporter ATP-binding protein [Woeseiaceae bacterium]